MKVLIDVNLSPKWVETLLEAGIQAVHWVQIGDLAAPDRTIFQWAQKEGYIVLTHDLDFGAILAATQAQGPSVVQIRTQDVSPKHLAPLMIHILKKYQPHLEKGALIVVDETKLRVRILPLGE